MAHNQQKEFCEKTKLIFPQFFNNKKVLDVGSLDINGSNKPLFDECEYIGVDVGEGKNVDIVSLGHELTFDDETFDVIISTEAFEHDMFYEKTIQNIIRMLKRGGFFIFSCATTGRPEHGTNKSSPHCAPLLNNIDVWCNYYQNLTEDDFIKIEGFTEAFPNGVFETNTTSHDLYFYGIKF